MSQTPASVAASLADTTQAERYRRGWKALSELIGQGRSFSGHELNCCFLNTGSARFAEVSASSGLAFADDARAVAVCDWDFDGRQDFWVTNRTAPRVRLLRNAGSGGHWLALKLRGTACNRDAIGARVVVTPADGSQRTKSLRAGDGFLAQSSKWLHFGLGAADVIDSLTIHWPGGEAETIGAVPVDAHYTIAQGSGTAAPWTPPDRESFTLRPGSLPVPEPDPAIRTWLIGRLPLPRVPGRPELPDKPFLLTLWSDRCQTCRAELAEWSAHADAIRKAGLEGIVLNVDPLLAEASAAPPAGLPFAKGAATAELAEALDLFHRTFVELQQPLPVPASFLLDRQGRVAVIYKGGVALDTLLADVKLLDRPESEARDAAVPFPGRWASNLFPPQPERLAGTFARAGRPDWRDRYLADYAAQDPSLDVLTHRGASLLAQGKLDEGVALFARLFENASDNPAAHRDAGALLLQHGANQPALAHFRVALPRFENDANFRFNLGLAEAANRNPEGALAHFRAAAALNPNDAAAQFQIANVLHATKRGHDAIPHYRAALRLRPGWNLPANNLAWLLATHPDPALRDGEQAVKLIEPVTAAEGGTNPATLATLAAARAEAGDFDRAVPTAERALELATQAGAQPLVQSLQSALQRYRASQPMRDPQ